MRNIPHNKALANLAKISHTRIKTGLQYYRIRKFYLDDRPDELYQKAIPIVKQ